MYHRLLIALMVLVALAACGGDSAPTPGEAKTFGTACDKANDGKRIALQGYLRFPESFSGDQSVVFRLYETASFSGAPVGVQMKFGSQANQAAMVSNRFSDQDLKVHLAKGGDAGFGTKVTISGSVYFPTVDQEFKCSLENPLIEAGA